MAIYPTGITKSRPLEVACKACKVEQSKLETSIAPLFDVVSASATDEVNTMLAPAGGVSSIPLVAPLNATSFNPGTPVVNVDARQLQLERQLQIYNQQLAVAQEAARQADQLQRQIAAVQQQIDQRQLENTRADLQADDLQQDNLQADNAADEAAAEQLRTDNFLADQQAEELRTDNLLADQRAEELRADDLAAERLADERLAADRLAADQLADAQNAAVIEPQIRPPTIDVSNLTTAQTTEPAASNEDLIPPLAPDDSGRLVDTLV
jgi:hypothetical protein